MVKLLKKIKFARKILTLLFKNFVSMSNYLVSARKYRPQNFNTVVGQEHITTTLKNAISSQHLAHSFLFCGPRGVGKTTCARILAKTINCLNITTEGEACNHCENCLNFENGRTFNIHELDAASNNSVDDIRELIEQVRFGPPSGKYKIYIIDEVHMLTTNAFNAFLKTLEEPPAHAIFILATTEKQKIIPTILSRCQIFDFKRIKISDTVKQLKFIAEQEHISFEQDALELIAFKTEGCMRDSLSLLDKVVSFTKGQVTYKNTISNLNILDEQDFFELLNLLQQEDLPAVLLWFDKLFQQGFEGSTILQVFQSFLRNLLVAKQTDISLLMEVLESSKPKFLEAAKQTDLFYIISMLQIVADSDKNYKEAINKRLHVELLLIKICYLNQALQISSEVNLVQQANKPSLLRVQPLPTFKVQRIPLANFPQTTPQTIPQSAQNTTYTESIQGQPKIFSGTSSTSAIVKTNVVIDVKPSSMPTLFENQQNSILDVLKSKYDNKLNINEIDEPQELDIERMQEIWQGFLKDIELQNPTIAEQLSVVEFKIINLGKFDIIFNSQIARSFFETYRNQVSDLYKKEFKNNGLIFGIKVNDDNSANNDLVPSYQTLSLKEKVQVLCENYPQVQKLCSELNLELSYN